MKTSCYYFNKSVCQSCNLLDDLTRLPQIPEELIRLCDHINPWERAQSPLGLRAKARLSISGTAKKPIVGILDQSLNGIELAGCPQHRKIIQATLKLIPSLITQFNLTPYSIKERSGELKGIILQTNQKEDHLRIKMITKSENLRIQLQNFAALLTSLVPVKTSIIQNIQPIPHQVPEGEEEFLLIGEELLWEQYNQIQIAFPSRSFMQVTPEVASKLYQKATEILEPYPQTKILDLFSGAGGFALSLASKAKEVLGIELSQEASEAAKISAEKNSFFNVSFRQADLNAMLLESSEYRPNVIVCNPPRRGLGDHVIEFIKRIKPELFLYSSCNANSFLKDYLELKEKYEIKELTPFEMFPLTNHFEILVKLERRVF